MLPDSWVDALLGRLTVRYGVAFMRQYGDIDPAAVKADWARVLSGLSGEAIAGGIKNLPAEKPPNAGQFRWLCIDAMPGEANRVFTALPAPVEPLAASVRERLESVRRKITASRAGA